MMAHQGYSLPPLRPQPLWTSLRALGNSPAIKLTIFIPIIGYLILLNEHVLHYLELSQRIFGNETQEGHTSAAPVSWRLLFLYFGLCLIAAASALHQLFCPTIIKRYASVSDFVSSAYPHLTDTGYEALCEELRQTTKVVHAERGEERRGHLALFFVLKNTCRPWARWPALILYVFGFGVLSIPTLNVFYRVAVVAFAMVHQSFSQ
jgi:hypothetical protein